MGFNKNCTVCKGTGWMPKKGSPEDAETAKLFGLSVDELALQPCNADGNDMGCYKAEIMAEVYEVVQIFPDGYEQHISISDTLEEAKRDIQEFPAKYRHNGRLEIKKRAENFGGDPEGKLAKALERAREKAKQPRKPLKIERLKGESFGAENKGMTDVWWAYKIDDEDWKDYTRFKRKHKDTVMANRDNEMEMFIEWRHEKSWENDEDIRYYLRFFDNPKSAQKFIGRTKVIYSDSGDEDDDELIRVYGRLDSEGIDYALFQGDSIDWELYPLLFSGNILSDYKQRAAESFGAESPQVDDEGMLGRIRKVRIVGIEDNNGKKDRKGNPIQNVYFYRDLLDSGEADWRIHTDSEREFLSRFKPDKRAETFNAEDEYEDLYDEMESKLRQRMEDGQRPSDIDLSSVVFEITNDAAGRSEHYSMLMSDGREMLRSWEEEEDEYGAETFGAETRSLAKRSWDTLNNVETAVGTVGLAHMIGLGAIIGGSFAFLKGRKSNSKTEQ